MKNVRGIAVVLMWVFVALAVLVPATEAQSVSTSRHWRTVPQGHYTSVHYHRHYHRHFYQVSALRADCSRPSRVWLSSNLALKPAVLSARAVSWVFPHPR